MHEHARALHRPPQSTIPPITPAAFFDLVVYERVTRALGRHRSLPQPVWMIIGEYVDVYTGRELGNLRRARHALNLIEMMEARSN